MSAGRSTNPETIARSRVIALARQRAFKVLSAQHAEEFDAIHAAERAKLGITEPWNRRNRRPA